mgnify:FL=1
MGRKDAFFLSRQLMRGNKWRMFLLHLSFIGWSILSLLTFGILDFLFVNPYQTATDAELYMTLRKNYIRSRAPRYELFNDPLLEQELSDDELLIRKALYDDSEGPYTKIAYFEPHQYPAFLFSVQPPVRAVHQPLAPTGSYHPLTLASLFFLFSILGWILETLSYLTMEGVFLNRSILLGPWIPLYGICGVLSVTMLHRFAKNPILAFCMNGLLYSVIGYLSDFYSPDDLARRPAQNFSILLSFSAASVFCGCRVPGTDRMHLPVFHRTKMETGYQKNPALVPALRMRSAGNADVVGRLLCLLSIIHNFCVE